MSRGVGGAGAAAFPAAASNTRRGLRFRNGVDPRDYGAVLGGSTDDTFAWQRTLIAARSAGIGTSDSVLFPTGLSVVNAPLDFALLGLWGQGQDTSILQAGSALRSGSGIGGASIVTPGSGYATTTGASGSGYGGTDYLPVTFGASQTPGGQQATGFAQCSGGQVTQVYMTNVGTGYTAPPQVTIPAPGGSGTQASASAAAPGMQYIARFSGDEPARTVRDFQVRGGLASGPDSGLSYGIGYVPAHVIGVMMGNGTSGQRSFENICALNCWAGFALNNVTGHIVRTHCEALACFYGTYNIFDGNDGLDIGCMWNNNWWASEGVAWNNVNGINTRTCIRNHYAVGPYGHYQETSRPLNQTQNQIEHVSRSGGVTGGTFRLAAQSGAVLSPSFAYNVTGAALARAWNDAMIASGATGDRLSGSGSGSSGDPWVLTSIGDWGGQSWPALVQGSGTALTPSGSVSSTISVAGAPVTYDIVAQNSLAGTDLAQLSAGVTNLQGPGSLALSTTVPGLAGVNQTELVTINGSPNLAASQFTLNVDGLGVIGSPGFGANSTGAQIQAAWDATKILCSGPAGGPWTFTYVGSWGNKPHVAMVQGGGTNWVGGTNPSVTSVIQTTGVVPVNETQRLTVTGALTGGWFTLTAQGQTTANIPFNAHHEQVTNELCKLSAVGNDNLRLHQVGAAAHILMADATYIACRWESVGNGAIYSDTYGGQTGTGGSIADVEIHGAGFYWQEALGLAGMPRKYAVEFGICNGFLTYRGGFQPFTHVQGDGTAFTNAHGAAPLAAWHCVFNSGTWHMQTGRYANSVVCDFGYLNQIMSEAFNGLINTDGQSRRGKIPAGQSSVTITPSWGGSPLASICPQVTLATDGGLAAPVLIAALVGSGPAFTVTVKGGPAVSDLFFFWNTGQCM